MKKEKSRHEKAAVRHAPAAAASFNDGDYF
jgi:hypothetical protein